MALHTRPRDLLAVALPISAGTLLQFVVVLTDNYFLSKLPESAINGAGNAGLVYLTLEMLAIASAASLQILIARRIGEGDRPAALRVFRTGVALNGVLGLLLLAIGAAANLGLLGGLFKDAATRDVFTAFFNVRMWGFLPFSILLAFNALYMGSARTWPILVVSGTAALVNVVFDAGWVTGWAGMTPMGPVGAARASLLAECVAVVLMVLLTWRVTPEALRTWAVLTRDEIRGWWRLAYPLMGQLLLTIATWTAFFFFVEKVGPMELKVSHIARNMFMLAFVVGQGMGQTTRTYVSGLLGEGRHTEIAGVVRRIVLLNLAGILLLTHGFVLYPDAIASTFFDDAAGHDAMVRTLPVVLSATLLFGVVTILLASLQGAGATRAAFRIELFGVSIYMLAVVAVTVVWPQPVWVIWRVEWAYFLSMGLGTFVVLRSKSWHELTRH
jgi:Na+-driven multidrug efflux pump